MSYISGFGRGLNAIGRVRLRSVAFDARGMILHEPLCAGLGKPLRTGASEGAFEALFHDVLRDVAADVLRDVAARFFGFTHGKAHVLGQVARRILRCGNEWSLRRAYSVLIRRIRPSCIRLRGVHFR